MAAAHPGAGRRGAPLRQSPGDARPVPVGVLVPAVRREEADEAAAEPRREALPVPAVRGAGEGAAAVTRLPAAGATQERRVRGRQGRRRKPSETSKEKCVWGEASEARAHRSGGGDGSGAGGGASDEHGGVGAGARRGDAGGDGPGGSAGGAGYGRVYRRRRDAGVYRGGSPGGQRGGNERHSRQAAALGRRGAAPEDAAFPRQS